MIVYVDTSALLKRVVLEPESATVRAYLTERYDAGDLLAASSLAWVEVWRALRRAAVADIDERARDALSGIAEYPLDESVLLRARRVGAGDLRSLAAIHLASAVALGADVFVTYDLRLAQSAELVGISPLGP